MASIRTVEPSCHRAPLVRTLTHTHGWRSRPAKAYRYRLATEEQTGASGNRGDNLITHRKHPQTRHREATCRFSTFMYPAQLYLLDPCMASHGAILAANTFLLAPGHRADCRQARMQSHPKRGRAWWSKALPSHVPPREVPTDQTLRQLGGPTRSQEGKSASRSRRG